MKKLKQIWHEIIERWFLLTFYAERMERERLQVLAELVKRKDTLNLICYSKSTITIVRRGPSKSTSTTFLKHLSQEGVSFRSQETNIFEKAFFQK
jgi:hypothetical protein